MLDLDGTLVDRQSAFERWAERLIASVRGDEEDLAWLIAEDAEGYRPRRELADAITARLPAGGRPERLERQLQLGVIESIACYEGVVEGLRRLRDAGVELVLVTNGTVRQQTAKLERTGLDAQLDRVVISEEIGVKKPDPRIFAAALDGVAADPGTWMVGDHPSADVGGARAAGLSTAWVSHGRPWPHTWRPTLSATTTAEILRSLARRACEVAGGVDERSDPALTASPAPPLSPHRERGPRARRAAGAPRSGSGSP